MKTIDEYTVLELIERYKDVIGEDIENFLCDTIYEGRHTEELKEAIGIKAIIKNDKKNTKVYCNIFHVYNCICIFINCNVKFFIKSII